MPGGVTLHPVVLIYCHHAVSSFTDNDGPPNKDVVWIIGGHDGAKRNRVPIQGTVQAVGIDP